MVYLLYLLLSFYKMSHLMLSSLETSIYIQQGAVLLTYILVINFPREMSLSVRI